MSKNREEKMNLDKKYLNTGVKFNDFKQAGNVTYQ